MKSMKLSKWVNAVVGAFPLTEKHLSFLTRKGDFYFTSF